MSTLSDDALASCRQSVRADTIRTLENTLAEVTAIEHSCMEAEPLVIRLALQALAANIRERLGSV